MASNTGPEGNRKHYLKDDVKKLDAPDGHLKNNWISPGNSNQVASRRFFGARNFDNDDAKWYMLRCAPKHVDNNSQGIFNDALDSTGGNRISARECSAILGLSPFTTRNELVMDKAGIHKKYVPLTNDIYRGIYLEPIALKTFADFLGVDINKLPCKHIRFSNFRLSGRPDGVFREGCNDIVVEVKCPKRNSRKCPVAYYIQLQVYIYLYGSPYGYYIEYITNKSLNIIKVSANQELISAMLCHISKFVEDVNRMTVLSKGTLNPN